jgi:hypothetical protein
MLERALEFPFAAFLLILSIPFVFFYSFSILTGTRRTVSPARTRDYASPLQSLGPGDFENAIEAYEALIDSTLTGRAR